MLVVLLRELVLPGFILSIVVIGVVGICQLMRVPVNPLTIILETVVGAGLGVCVLLALDKTFGIYRENRYKEPLCQVKK
jgi:hypothetical protein